MAQDAQRAHKYFMICLNSNPTNYLPTFRSAIRLCDAVSGAEMRGFLTTVFLILACHS